MRAIARISPPPLVPFSSSTLHFSVHGECSPLVSWSFGRPGQLAGLFTCPVREAGSFRPKARQYTIYHRSDLSLSGGFMPCQHLRPRTYSHNLFRPVMMMNETRRKPTTGTRCPTLFVKWHRIFYMPSHTDTAGHTKVFDYPVTQTRLDIPRSLITQSHRHGWTYQGIDYPVTQTRLDIPRPLITQSHRHDWTYQGL